MILLAFGAVAAGFFCTAFTLWVTGYAGGASVQASQRLARIREAQPLGGMSTPTNALRRRASVNFGGLDLVSSRMAARLATQLERAGLMLNPKEYFLLRLGVSAGFAVAGFFVSPVPVAGLLAGVAGYWLVGIWLQRRITKRTQQLEAQLIELLSLVSSALRSGFGLLQALEAGAEQLPAPISVEMRRALRDTSMGASVEQALIAMNDRIGSADWDIVVSAILIQRSVGGNLAEILDNVAHTMRERERIRGEIRTLTAQQRMTGFVIGGIPVALGIAFYMLNPEFERLLFTDELGRMMLGAALLLEFVGFLIIRKIVNIEV